MGLGRVPGATVSAIHTELRAQKGPASLTMTESIVSKVIRFEAA